jgi:hypothetical protein
MKKINVFNVDNASDFIGYKITNEGVEIYKPTLLRFSPFELSLKKDIVSFLKTLSIGYTKDEIYYNALKLNSNLTSWPIDSYIWILKDYLENGVFFAYEKEYNHNSGGKINWKRSFRKNPIINKGNIIYSDLIIEKNKHKIQDISEIHKYCVMISNDIIGWLFDYNIYIENDFHYLPMVMIDIINKELNNTFDDKKKLRFQHLIMIIESQSRTKNYQKFGGFGVNNYYYIYEKMIDNIFGNITNNLRREFYPNTYWILTDEKIKFNNPLIPDSIYIDNDIIYIIDAKMYQFAINYNKLYLPGSQSIQKQITYGDYIQNKYPTKKVFNIFILPKNDIYNNMNYIGYAEADWRNNEKKSYDKIHCFLIDFNYLCHTYKNDSELIKQIISFFK